MTIQLNGEKTVLEKTPVFLSELLSLQKVESPEQVSVQVNGKFIDKSRFGAILITENDEVDFLYFLGGGAR